MNEQVHGPSERFAVLAPPLNVVCECERFDCYERIEITLDAYEQIRSDSVRFVIRPRRAAPDVEDVVERHEGYWWYASMKANPPSWPGARTTRRPSRAAAASRRPCSDRAAPPA